jgi:PAS domain S-box-containing protein
VLVVEDSEDDAAMILRELGRAGHETEYRRVQTPEAMREALADAGWDLIVSDHRMPRFSAPQALELAREAGSEAPFVLVSGRIGEAAAAGLVNAGAHDYVMKDNLARLRPTVERALEEAEARRKRRRAEEELGRSEGRYRAVIEQATDGIYLLDAASKRLLETNPAFRRMLGYREDEMRGMQVYDFVAQPRENVDAVIRRTLEQKRRFVGERRYSRKDGSLLDVEVGVSVISEGGKEVICTIVRDVTERKRAEEKLLASEAELRAVFGP